MYDDLEGKSAFDEIDKSDEYNIEYYSDKDIYSMRIETIYNYVKYSTLYLKDSHIESMNCDLEYLLDFIYYNKINFEEKDNYDDFY